MSSSLASISIPEAPAYAHTLGGLGGANAAALDATLPGSAAGGLVGLGLAGPIGRPGLAEKGAPWVVYGCKSEEGEGGRMSLSRLPLLGREN